jgi:hypothetical protein
MKKCNVNTAALLTKSLCNAYGQYYGLGMETPSQASWPPRPTSCCIMALICSARSGSERVNASNARATGPSPQRCPRAGNAAAGAPAALAAPLMPAGPAPAAREPAAPAAVAASPAPPAGSMKSVPWLKRMLPAMVGCARLELTVRLPSNWPAGTQRGSHGYVCYCGNAARYECVLLKQQSRQRPLLSPKDLQKVQQSLWLAPGFNSRTSRRKTQPGARREVQSGPARAIGTSIAADMSSSWLKSRRPALLALGSVHRLGHLLPPAPTCVDVPQPQLQPVHLCSQLGGDCSRLARLTTPRLALLLLLVLLLLLGAHRQTAAHPATDEVPIRSFQHLI